MELPWQGERKARREWRNEIHSERIQCSEEEKTRGCDREGGIWTELWTIWEWAATPRTGEGEGGLGRRARRWLSAQRSSWIDRVDSRKGGKRWRQGRRQSIVGYGNSKWETIQWPQNGVSSNMLVFTYIHAAHRKPLTQETDTDHVLCTTSAVTEELFKRDATESYSGIFCSLCFFKIISKNNTRSFTLINSKITENNNFHFNITFMLYATS